MVKAMITFPKILIALVNGPAVGNYLIFTGGLCGKVVFGREFPQKNVAECLLT